MSERKQSRSANQWSPGFFEHLRKVDDETIADVDEMLAAILANRSSTNHFDWWTNDLPDNET